MSDKEPFSLKAEGESKQETEKLFQMLEVKLGQERVVWEQAKSQIRVVRTASFVFLFVLILGAIAAGYFVFVRTQEHRATKGEQTTTLPDR